MSNQFLNKLKNVETSRANLENILASKDIDVGTSKSLPSLVAQVSKLKNPNWTENDEKWAGLVEREAPVDYYKGDDDWKDLINIDQIIEDNDSTSYQGAVFMLFRVSANPDNSWSSSYFGGFNAYKFSDNPSSTPTSAAHTWNEDNDIVAENGERFRWVICFTSSTTCTGAWSPTYLVPEAVVYYKGQFRLCVLYSSYNSYRYLSSYNSPTSTSTSSSYVGIGSTNGASNSPKYFEIKEGVTCDVVAGSSSNYYPVRTVIINGLVKSSVYLGKCPNLRYFVYNNEVAPQLRFNFPEGISATEDDRCYIKVNGDINLRSDSGSDSNFYLGNFTNNNCVDLYLNNIKYPYYDYNTFGRNTNCNIKIADVTFVENQSSDSGGPFSFNYRCNIDIGDVSLVPPYTFSDSQDTNIKIGTIWGGIGDCAFLNCNKMNTDIICKSNSSTTYRLGRQPFYGTRIKLIDMSESRISSISSTSSIYSTGFSSDYRWRYMMSSSFARNTNIEVIKLSNFITSLGACSFYEMSNLKELYLGNSITSIGERCFMNCTSLETVTLPATVQSISEYAFSNCVTLKTVDLGQQITRIPKNCFEYCESLENVILPNSLTTFEEYCFFHCSSLKSIDLPNELTILPQYCFSLCKLLESVNSTGKITNIGQYCFNGCGKLKNIFDMSNVISISERAFYECESLLIKLNNLSGIVNTNALKDTKTSILCDTDFDIVSNLYLWGAKWTNENVLGFLYSLPTREEQSDYTIYMGYSSPAYYSGNETPSNSIYQYIKNKYVIEQDGKLVYTDQATGGAQTIQQYVNAKKWVLA